MAHTPLDELALSLNGNYIDRDGAPPDQPYQCHDVWLALLTDLLGLPVRLGWAPGYYGHTYEVWNQFPAVAGLDAHFTKHGGHAIQAGDVVFWPVSARYPGTHVVLALGPVDPVDGTILCVTQNPGPATITRLSAEGAAGFLRPNAQWINTAQATAAAPPSEPEKEMPLTYISRDTNARKKPAQTIKENTPLYLEHGDSSTAISDGAGDHWGTAEIRVKGKPGAVVDLLCERYVWDGKKYVSRVHITRYEPIVIGASGIGVTAVPVSNRVPADGSRLGILATVAKGGGQVTVERFAAKLHKSIV